MKGGMGRCSSTYSAESRKTIRTYISAQFIIKFKTAVINYKLKNEKHDFSIMVP